MRVLHCIASMEGGGAERQLAYLAKGLGVAGLDVHVALGSEGPNFARLQGTGATIHRLRSGTLANRDPRLLTGMLTLLRRLRPDVMQVWLPQMEVVGGLAALATSTPWVFSERCSDGAYPWSARMLARRAMASFATAIVSNSAAGDRYWQPRVGNRVRRYVIPNAVPVDEIASTPAARPEDLGLKSGIPIVLFAGRLDRQKNLDALLPALERVLARHDVQVLCCGEGPLEARCTKWITERGLTARVRLAGYVPNLWNIMKLATVFVSPSLFEGSPNVVLEAMASGCPLVVSHIPAHRELVDDDSAVLVDPLVPERIADGLEKVMSDPQGSAARARNARAATKAYTVAAVAQQYAGVYEEVVAESVSAPVKVAR